MESDVNLNQSMQEFFEQLQHETIVNAIDELLANKSDDYIAGYAECLKHFFQTAMRASDDDISEEEALNAFTLLISANLESVAKVFKSGEGNEY